MLQPCTHSENCFQRVMSLTQSLIVIIGRLPVAIYLTVNKKRGSNHV